MAQPARNDRPAPARPPQEAIDAALKQASDELGLEEWYRDCVRPLIRSGRAGYPSCCGGGCEPCSQILVLVADRVLELLGVDKLE